MVVFIMEKLIEYLKRVDYAVNHDGKVNSDEKPDFFLVCPCCGTQEGLPLFFDNGISVKFGNVDGAQGEFHYPFHKPKTSGFDDYYKLVNSLQKTPTNYMIEAKYLYLGRGKPTPYELAYDHNKTNLFILSPCWGLVSADFKLPRYNFEFRVRQRLSRLGDHYRYINQKGKDNCPAWAGKGFNHLDSEAKKNPQKPIVILGGANYIYRFYGIYSDCKWVNPVYAIVGESNIANEISAPTWKFIKVQGNQNWHYQYMKRI